MQLWIHCPACGVKVRINELDPNRFSTVPLYCPSCQRRLTMNLVQLQRAIAKATRQSDFT